MRSMINLSLHGFRLAGIFQRSLSNKSSVICLSQRCIWPLNTRLYSVQQQFEEAKQRLSSLEEDPGNEVKLKLYGLYKQSVEGPVESDRPGPLDFVGRAKWDAWNSNKNLSKDEAQQGYIKVIDSLLKKGQPAEASTVDSNQKFKNLLIEMEGSVRKITLNRPNKYNALTYDMYGEVADALSDAKADPKTVITVLTGAGQYYCSGNDLSNFTNVTPDTIQEVIDSGYSVLKRFVASFIDFNKPLIAVINGPAVGVSVTVLALFDAVYATDKATFHTPFSALGQSPEGCSSVIFPRLMGFGKASELLFFNKKITAAEACELNLVTEVFPDHSFQKEVWPRIQAYSKLPTKSLNYSKQLVRGVDIGTLHKANEMECERLRERWASDDCMNAIMAFFKRK